MKLITPKRLRADNAKTRSLTQEKQRAKELGGYATRGSGAGREKGDVRKKGVLRLECKTTSAKSFRVTQEMIDKIEEAALTHDEVPAIEVEFLNESGKPYRSVTIIPTYAFTELFDAS